MIGGLHGRTAAIGFAIVEMGSLRAYLGCVIILVLRGIIPWGSYVFPITDESIHPTLRRGRLRILAGWDNFMGYSLLADSPDSDSFLRAFAARRGASSGS